MVVESNCSPVIPAKAGIHPAGGHCKLTGWIPAPEGDRNDRFADSLDDKMTNSIMDSCFRRNDRLADSLDDKMTNSIMDSCIRRNDG